MVCIVIISIQINNNKKTIDASVKIGPMTYLIRRLMLICLFIGINEHRLCKFGVQLLRKLINCFVMFRPGQNDCVVPVSRPILIFQPDPKTFYQVLKKSKKKKLFKSFIMYICNH